MVNGMLWGEKSTQYGIIIRGMLYELSIIQQPLAVIHL